MAQKKRIRDGERERNGRGEWERENWQEICEVDGASIKGINLGKDIPYTALLQLFCKDKAANKTTQGITFKISWEKRLIISEQIISKISQANLLNLEMGKLRPGVEQLPVKVQVYTQAHTHAQISFQHTACSSSHTFLENLYPI
jgi:hypothetical protein